MPFTPPPCRELALEAQVAHGEQEDLVTGRSLEDKPRVITRRMAADRKRWDDSMKLPEDTPTRKLSAPPLPTAPEQLFGCRTKLQDVLGRACVELQHGDADDEANHDRFCASGECIQGARVRAVLERLRARRVCAQCRRVELGETNTDGSCSSCRTPEAHVRLSTQLPAVRTHQPSNQERLRGIFKPSPILQDLPFKTVPLAPAKVRAEPEPEADDCRCEECGAELARGETDICASCRAHDAELAAAPLQAPKQPAPKPTPVSPPAPPPEQEKPMPEAKTCIIEGCSEPLRINNLSGLCKHHKHLRKPTPGSSPRGAPRQGHLAIAITEAVLPPIKAIANEFLLQAVDELVRRRDELVRATRKLGLKDTAAEPLGFAAVDAG